jgi:hypothetical protein
MLEDPSGKESMKRVGYFRVFNLNTAVYKFMSLAREVYGCLRQLHGMIEPPYPFFDSFCWRL